MTAGACGCGGPWVQNTVPSVSCSGAPRVTAARWRSWPPWGWCTGTGLAGGPPVLAPAPAEAAWSPGDGGATCDRMDFIYYLCTICGDSFPPRTGAPSAVREKVKVSSRVFGLWLFSAQNFYMPKRHFLVASFVPL